MGTELTDLVPGRPQLLSGSAVCPSRCFTTVRHPPRMRNVRNAPAGHARIVNSSTPRPPSSACNAQRVARTRLRVTLCVFAPPQEVRVLTVAHLGQKRWYGSQRTRRLRTDRH